MHGLRWALLPAASGVLCILAFPKADQGYLAWISLTPLVVFLYRAPSAGSAFCGGFLSGIFQFSALLIWIPQVLTRYGGVPAAVAWLLFMLLAAFLSLFPAAACALTRFASLRVRDYLLFLFPPSWVALEYARNYIPFGGFPWLLMGYSQTSYLRLIQISDTIGVYGVSFMILWINTALGWAICRRDTRGALRPLLGGAVALGACAFYGDSTLRVWQAVDSRWSAALLQGNLSFDEPENSLARKFKDGYVQMADRIAPSEIDLLVLPESPSPLMFQRDGAYRATMEELARRYTLGMIFNNVGVSAQSVEERYFNSAYFLDGKGRELGRYDKVHLVPFGEYIPARKLFFFAETITKDVSDFQSGDSFRVISMSGHPVSALICFEAVFPEVAREFTRRGSHLLVNLTNDGWYGNSAAAYQHLSMARWRAVENRRYLLRATNTGISAIVAPTGELHASTGLLREEICQGRFAFISWQSRYSRHGDIFAALCAIITGVAPLLSFGSGWITARLRPSRHPGG